jgi:putative lysine transport system substrate-binding protein
MKKLLCLLLATVMVFGLVACGGGSSTSEESEDGGKATSDGKTLKVAMECGYAPYNWTQPDDSNGAVPINDSSDFAYGYDVMMAKKIADELGYELQIVKLDWDSLVPAVQSGTIDCVIAGQSITSERLEMVDFTEPYYYASIVSLVKNDSQYANAKGKSELVGATCTSQLGTIWYDKCLPQIASEDGKNVLTAAETAPAMLDALNSGRCDVVVTDLPTAQAALIAYPDFKLLDFTGQDDNFEVSDEDINIGISVRKGNKELVDQINSVLSKMTTDDYNSMMDEAISVQPLS